MTEHQQRGGLTAAERALLLAIGKRMAHQIDPDRGEYWRRERQMLEDAIKAVEVEASSMPPPVQ